MFHSYEADFVLTVKQYMRHMPPLEEGTKQDLFMGAITNPAGNVWYNKVLKVSKERAGAWLANMLKLVGLSADVFSNRSGRATLITRMAARGVPDEVGMLISGHHTINGYLRYDRTKAIKMEAATLVAANPLLSYESAIKEVSKKFFEEEIVGSASALNPLTSLIAGEGEMRAGTSTAVQQNASSTTTHLVKPLIDRVSEKSALQLSLAPESAEVQMLYDILTLF